MSSLSIGSNQKNLRMIKKQISNLRDSFQNQFHNQIYIFKRCLRWQEVERFEENVNIYRKNTVEAIIIVWWLWLEKERSDQGQRMYYFGYFEFKWLWGSKWKYQIGSCLYDVQRTVLEQIWVSRSLAFQMTSVK